jgi:hypothetical protein
MLALNAARCRARRRQEMIMIRRAFAVVVTGLWLLVPASAEDAPPAPENDEARYTFSKVTDGFLRLDTKTGEVSLCSQQTVGWACVAVPDDRALLENEIARLRAENGALKKDLLARGLPLPPGAMPEPPPLRPDRAPYWSDRSNLDRMMAFAHRLWHRLVEAIARAQRQVLNRS